MNPAHIVALLALCLPTLALADAVSPEGQWRSIDDETGKPKGVVEVRIEEGELSGRLLRLIEPSEPDPVCKACEGERKDQPIEGMVILWGLSGSGADWDDGKVLDPESGKVYDASVTVIDGGARLELRGYMGVSWLGRTQVWERIDTAAP
ncbi:DUF2147 domain-containing protein [Parahaliea aestuarii]|uniref:DUF2147 domain-containing protein n=1 Tax=Parahaliea aestuarii TaxID=1852021 RepID=A0A5C8ZL70_9GAMM|nr:DUF2147 domain-containing protein [Parahaliea aestuarii]TXS89326.1 DUF2147 domain-containing protein [Parahaliea aestuarii]